MPAMIRCPKCGDGVVLVGPLPEACRFEDNCGQPIVSLLLGCEGGKHDCVPVCERHASDAPMEAVGDGTA